MFDLYTLQALDQTLASKRVNKYIPPHKHEFWEFTFTHENTTTHYVNGMQVDCPKMSTVLLMKPGDTHSLYKKDYHLHYDIYVSDEKMQTICNLIDKNLYEDLVSAAEPIVISSKFKDLYSVEQSLDAIIASQGKGEPVSRFSEGLHTTVICQILGCYYKNKLTDDALYPDWINDFFHKLKSEEFLCKPLKELIDDLYYSRGYLSHTFKKYVHETMEQCFCRAKVEYSTHLLADKSLSILDISMRLNYCSQCAYISAFKKYYGITPNKWRKENAVD